MNKALLKVIDILKMLPNKKNLDFSEKQSAKLILDDGKTLMNISDQNIVIPGLSIPASLFDKKNPLKDSFVQDSQIKNLFDHLSSNHLYQRLNHLGLCYYVESITKEKRKLIDEIKKTDWHLYEEDSQDESAWIYIGNTANWENPLIELVLIEKTNDKWKDYWLPHIQIDIDTNLNGDEIEKLILDNFEGKIKPYRLIEINEFIVLVRARLGIISGININLDFGFEGRMTRHHRTKLLKKLA